MTSGGVALMGLALVLALSPRAVAQEWETGPPDPAETPEPAPPPPPEPPAAPLQLQPPLPPPGFVPIVMHGSSPGVVVSLSLEKKGAPLFRCVGQCLSYVAPREYFVAVEASDEHVGGRRKVSVSGPTELWVTPRSQSTRNTGLGLGVGGIVAMAGGALLAVAGLQRELEGREGGTLITLGLTGMIGGAVLTPIGWVMFGRSAPAVESRPLR